MRAWIDVAVLAKPKNLKGRLVVRGTAGLPFLLQPGDEVAFVPPQTDQPRNAVVASVDLVDDRTAEVEFEGVDGDAAHALVGCHCLLRRSELDDSVYEEEPAMWDGWRVIDEAAGDVGVVAEIIENPGQVLLQVERPDGGEVLIPAVDEIVIDVDVEEALVRVKLPNGLLEL